MHSRQAEGRNSQSARRAVVHALTTLLAVAAAGSLLASAGAFERILELEKVTFKITCANDSSLPLLTIVPSGLQLDNSPIRRQVDGTVIGAEAGDLNEDGSPEVYVYVQSAGSGSYGSLVAYSANRRKSMSEIHLPSITDSPGASAGYMGHDSFTVLGTSLVRSFPLYRDGDPNASPSGRTRKVHYALVPGEAGWLLQIDRVVEE